jgi:hypothetical protein
MKYLMLVTLSTLMMLSCNAQENKELNKKETETLKEKIEPKIGYKVNKEYDENGNLIRLDSTYSYYYANIDKDVMINDSIFKKFNQYFNHNSHFNNSLFDDFFKQDNYLENDFFKEDFFSGNFERNQKIINSLFQRMDSIKNNFLLEQFPLDQIYKSNR